MPAGYAPPDEEPEDGDSTSIENLDASYMMRPVVFFVVAVRSVVYIAALAGFVVRWLASKLQRRLRH